ncbi:MAG TPA: non-homologous end-joining DNA ligase [Bacillales bacterium]|nr:non-homologous end-joining DNA ligase [Bacillales bacterium]
MAVDRKKPMLPTLVSELPKGDDWRYEVKYDGYRAALSLTKDRIDLMSRNLHSLNETFPDVIEGVRPFLKKLDGKLPIYLDGELCILASDHKADFETMQTRGRTKNQQKITTLAEINRADYVAFDLLSYQGQNLRNKPYAERKQQLRQLFSSLDLPLDVHQGAPHPLHYVPFYTGGDHFWQQIKAWDSEGVVAKKTDSRWLSGKRTRSWLKIKNWKTASFFITAYDKDSGYFHVAVLRDGEPYTIGNFSHGLEGEERNALIHIMRKNQIEETARIIMIAPSICVDLQFIELYKEGLRQPRFKAFRLDINWEDCTWEAVLRNIQNSKSMETK